jgi:hypothetical protein
VLISVDRLVLAARASRWARLAVVVSQGSGTRHWILQVEEAADDRLVRNARSTANVSYGSRSSACGERRD